MKITIIGFGYIGSVISAVLSSKGNKVTAIDTNKESIEELNRGICRIPEPSLQDIISNSVTEGFLSGSVSYESVNESDVILVTVGTSLSDEYDADLSALEDVFRNLSKFKIENKVLMIKSTIPPGVTRKLAKDHFGLKENIYIGFSPERLAEGNALKELQELPIIVGGINDISTKKCADFWTNALGVKVIEVSNCETAELVKLANNQWIDTNIALANELAILCDSLPYELDILEVIKGANSLKKGQHFVNILSPSIGVGGYCLTKDPWFLSALGEKNQTPLQIPRTGRSVNDFMPSYCVNKIFENLKNNGTKLEDAKIAILGYSFKDNSGDIRFSPIIDFANILIERGCSTINIFDSIIDKKKLTNKNLKIFQTWEECVEKVDVVVFGTAHDDIRSIKIDNLCLLLNNNALVFDGRRYFAKKDINTFKKLGIRYLGIGR